MRQKQSVDCQAAVFIGIELLPQVCNQGDCQVYFKLWRLLLNMH